MGWGWGGGHLDPHRWLLCLWFLWKSKPPMKWPPPIKKKENIEATNEKKWLKCPHTHTHNITINKNHHRKVFCVCVWVCARDFLLVSFNFFLGLFFCCHPFSYSSSISFFRVPFIVFSFLLTSPLGVDPDACFFFIQGKRRVIELKKKNGIEMESESRSGCRSEYLGNKKKLGKSR